VTTQKKNTEKKRGITRPRPDGGVINVYNMYMKQALERHAVKTQNLFWLSFLSVEKVGKENASNMYLHSMFN